MNPVRSLSFALLVLFSFCVPALRAAEPAALLLATPPPLVVAPDFQSLPGEPWKIMYGAWTASDGVLRAAELPEHKHVALLQHQIGLESAIIECEIRLDGAQSVSFGCDGRKHVARVTVRPDGIDLAEGSAKPAPIIAKLAGPIAPGVWHRLRLEWTGDRMAARVGEHEIRAQTPWLATPKTRSWIVVSKASVEVRNFTIRGIGQPPAAPTQK